MSKTMRLGPALLMSAVVTIGIGAAWCAVALWLYSTISAAQRRQDYEQLYIGADGEPLIVRVSRETAATRRVVGLDGLPRQVPTQDLLYPPYLHTPELMAPVLAGQNWNYRIAATNDSGLPPIFWYLVHDGRNSSRAFGVGYHSQTKRIVGYFASGGFSDSMPPRDQWFRVPGNHGLFEATTLNVGAREPHYVGTLPRFLLLADGKLWQVDLVLRQVKALFDCPRAFAVGQAWKIEAERPPPAANGFRRSAQEFTPMVGLVRQPGSLLLVDEGAGSHVEFVVPPGLRNKAIAAALLTDGNLLVFALQSPTGSAYDVAKLSPTGEITSQQHVELAPWSRQASLSEIGWVAALAAPLPAASAVVASVMTHWITFRDESRTYASALGEVMSNAWPSMVAVLVAGLLAALAAYRRQRRFGLPHAAFWSIFVFLFGVPGWLAYRFHRSWPVLEDCPSCRQPAPRDRSACFDCGAPFPPPPLKGIEVFAATHA